MLVLPAWPGTQVSHARCWDTRSKAGVVRAPRRASLFASPSAWLTSSVPNLLHTPSDTAGRGGHGGALWTSSSKESRHWCLHRKLRVPLPAGATPQGSPELGRCPLGLLPVPWVFFLSSAAASLPVRAWPHPSLAQEAGESDRQDLPLAL